MHGSQRSRLINPKTLKHTTPNGITIMAMTAQFDPSTGESTIVNRGNGGHTVSAEDIGYFSEADGQFQFEQLEQSDPTYREQFSDNDNALADVDQFALDAAFALAGGEGLVREAIATASQWLDAASIDYFDEKVEELCSIREFSALQEVFEDLVARYKEAGGGVASSEAAPNYQEIDEEESQLYESFSADRDFDNAYFEIAADEFVAELSQSDVNDALDLWDSTNVNRAQRAVEYASSFPVDHPVHLAAEALAYVAVGEEHPRQVFEGLAGIIGEAQALSAFAQILDNIN